MKRKSAVGLSGLDGQELQVHVGHVLAWTNFLGLGGVVAKVRVVSLCSWHKGSEVDAAMLDVEPSEELARFYATLPEDWRERHYHLAAVRGDGGALAVTGEALQRDAARGWVSIVGPECHCTYGYRCMPEVGRHREACPLTVEERSMANGPTRSSDPEVAEVSRSVAENNAEREEERRRIPDPREAWRLRYTDPEEYRRRMGG